MRREHAISHVIDNEVTHGTNMPTAHQRLDEDIVVSVEPAEGHGGVHNVKYFAGPRRLMANVVVPLSELEELGSAEALQRQFLVLVDRIVARLGGDGAEWAEQLRAAVPRAFEGVDG